MVTAIYKYLLIVCLFPCVLFGQQSMVVFDGNSLTFGTGSSDPATKSTSAQVDLGGVDIRNVGIAGERVVTNVGAKVKIEFDTSQVGASLVLVFREGINDIAVGNSVDNITNAIDTYITNVRASNATVSILGCTMTDYVGMGGTLQTRVDQVNTHIVSFADFDFTVDLATNVNLDDPSDATYYSDTTHHTDAGYLVCAQMVEAVILANGLTDTNAFWWHGYDPTTEGLKFGGAN